MTLLLVLFLGLIGTWALSKVEPSQRDLLSVCFSFLLVIVWNWKVLARLPEIIKQDTIVNLSPANAVWLVMISLTLSLCFVFASVLKTRYLTCAFNRYSPGRSSLWVFFVASDVLFTFITFVVALAAAPQLFYTYYRLIIPGLPFQWVFADVDFKRALDVLAINQAEVLSKLSMGLLLSTLLVTICWSWVLLNPLYKNWADDRT